MEKDKSEKLKNITGSPMTRSKSVERVTRAGIHAKLTMSPVAEMAPEMDVGKEIDAELEATLARQTETEATGERATASSSSMPTKSTPGLHMAQLIARELDIIQGRQTRQEITNELAIIMEENPKIQKMINAADTLEKHADKDRTLMRKEMADHDFRIRAEREHWIEEMAKEREKHNQSMDELRHKVENLIRHGYYTTQTMLVEHLRDLRHNLPPASSPTRNIKLPNLLQQVPHLF